MELEKFPFDRQLCAIRLTAELPAEVFQFVPNFDSNYRGVRVVDEWKIDEDMQDKCTLYVKPLQFHFKRANYQKSNLRIVLHMERKATFYNYNVFLMLFGIGLASLTSFTIDLKDKGDRVSVQVTFLLIVVAYKYG